MAYFKKKKVFRCSNTRYCFVFLQISVHLDDVTLRFSYVIFPRPRRLFGSFQWNVYYITKILDIIKVNIALTVMYLLIKFHV